MKFSIIIILLLFSIIFGQSNDSIIGYIFQNRHLFEQYFGKDIPESNNSLFVLINGHKPHPNVWQREYLFIDITNIEVFYKNSDEIIRSMIRNRKLTNNPSFFNIIIPLIKERREIGSLGRGLTLLRDIPVDILVKNQDRIRDLLDYLIARDSIRWNDERYISEFDNRFMGYPLTATLARLDNVRDYQLVPVRSSELWSWQNDVISILADCGKDMEEIYKRRFMRASELLRIAENCSDESIKERMIAHIERSANVVDSTINMFVNQNFSREELVANFLQDPVRYSWYVRRLGNDWVISQIVPYLVNERSGNFPDSEATTDFLYFVPLLTILRELYYDFDIEGKYFPPETNYADGRRWQSVHVLIERARERGETEAYNRLVAAARPFDPRPFSEVFSINYMDFVRRYEEWIQRRFGVGLNRQPQPTDIINNNPARSR